MSKPTNKIDKLIAALCPEGVEVKELGEVCIIKTGQAVNKIDISQNPGEFPVINSGREPLGFIDKYNTEDDPIGITTRGAGVGSVTWCEGKYFRGNLNYSATINDLNQLNTRFLYHLLLQDQTGIQQLATYQGIPALNKSNLEKLKIPLPPLAIQEEIVKILDTFTTLEAELEAELEARKKQYEYYRDELLTFGKDVVLSTLSDVAHFMNGKGHEKHIDENGRYIVVNSKFVSTEGRVKKYSVKQICPVSENDILMVMSDLPNGKALAKCFYVDENDKYTLNQRICALTVKNNKELNAKFLFYTLNRNKQLLRYDSGADQTNLRKDDILNIQIPIPPLAEQQRIVAILDKFDALVNDISAGLPAELNARRKQYEYYRDKLLTFKEFHSSRGQPPRPGGHPSRGGE
jgi:type I restriction enzyme S subunit